MKKNEEKKEVKAVTEEVKAEVKEEILQAPSVPDTQEDNSSDLEESFHKITPIHAEWITERGGFTQKSHCSHCSAAAMAIRGSNDETLTPFCPMCGYIMK